MAWFIYRNIAWSVSVAIHAFGRQSLVWLKLLRCHGWRGNNIINIRFIIMGMAVDLIMTGSVNITSIAAIKWCCMFIGLSFGDEVK